MLGIAETYAGKVQQVTGAGAQADLRQDNRIAQLVDIQNACLANAALILSSLDFAVVDDAQTVRLRFETVALGLQDTIGQYGGFPDVYRDLLRLRSAVFNDLVDRSAALPVIQTRTVNTETGASQYAYQRYGDADRVTEILERNDVRRSLFLSGDLELLSQ
jgi:prophage DNA circulation protein